MRDAGGNRRPKRHRGDAGFTLIDTLVAIAIMTISIVAITGAFAAAARLTYGGNDLAQREAVMRGVTDTLRSSVFGATSGGPVVAYVPCENSAGSDYKTNVTGLLPAGWSLSISVSQASSATTTPPGGAASAEQPLTFASAPACKSDYGVERLQVIITSSSGRSLARVIFKGYDS